MHPQLITISFVPDGTLMTSGPNGKVYSNLFATLNAKYPTATWEDAILTAAQTWAQQANINFDVVKDNGTTSGQGLYQQGDPKMGDVRIGGYRFGNSYLAGTYLPPPADNYSIAGDFNFNTSQNLNLGATYDIQTVALHELGHALGLAHSTAPNAVMYPYYHGITRTLTGADIASIQAVYGARQPDAYNVKPATSNLTITAAASLNAQINLSNLTAVVNNLSINSTTQSEYFKFTAPAGTGNTLKVTVQSAGLSMFTPSVTVYAANRSTVLGSVISPIQYHGVTVSVPISGVTPGQQFYVKVSGADNSVFSTGVYGLTLNFGTTAAPTAALPNTQILNGAMLIGGGGLAMAPKMDLLSPSEDLVPPCCAGHGGGCGCPACRAAATETVAAIDSQEQRAESSRALWEKQSEQTQTTSLFGARGANELAPAPEQQANTAAWPGACDQCFSDGTWLREMLSGLGLDS
jgi:predicted Zn-dependent protease